VNSKVGDICISRPQYPAARWLIAEISDRDTKFPLRAINLVNKKGYQIREDGLIKIGELSPEMSVDKVLSLLAARPPLPAEESQEYQVGRYRAEYCAQTADPESRKRWEILAKAKPGDQILIARSNGTELVTFHHVVEGGEKYVFLAANQKGRLYRYPLVALVLQ
jgi:hypothetical protein